MVQRLLRFPLALKIQTNSKTSVSSLRGSYLHLEILLHVLLLLVVMGLLGNRPGPLTGDKKNNQQLNDTSSSMNLGYQVQYFVKFLLPRTGDPTGNHKHWTLIIDR